MDLSFRNLPVSTFAELKAALTTFFNCHPYLTQLLSHPDGIQEQVDLWPIMEDLLADGGEYTISDLIDDIESIIDDLVTYNNNPWNFDPNYTPPKVSCKTALMLARCLCGQRELLRLELDANQLGGGPRMAVMYTWKTWSCIEVWTWPAGERTYDLGGVSSTQPYHTQDLISRHRKVELATKAFEKLTKSWELHEVVEE